MRTPESRFDASTLGIKCIGSIDPATSSAKLHSLCSIFGINTILGEDGVYHPGGGLAPEDERLYLALIGLLEHRFSIAADRPARRGPDSGTGSATPPPSAE